MLTFINAIMNHVPNKYSNLEEYNKLEFIKLTWI
jgi:hypothetical protein